jgi:F-type H+-transporting ATPase subunit alpha
LAQFDELAAFSQFASDLDKATQLQLERGRRLREILKQPQFSPIPVAEQVALIYTATNGFLDDVPVEKVLEFTTGLRRYLNTNKPKFIELVKQEKKLGDEATNLLKEAIAEYKQTVMAAA